MKKDFYIVSDEDSSVIFHKPTGMLAMLPDGCIPESERDFEMLEKKLENVPRISGHVKRHFGEGKITLTYMSARICNMGCTYCFAGEGEYGGCCGKPALFTKEMYLKGFHKALSYYPEGLDRIAFFGGEPLLNYPVIKEFVPEVIEYCTANGLDIPEFTMTTNGSLINEEIAEFINRYDFRITVSLDGGKDVNDSARCFKNSHRSAYEAAAEKCRLLESIGKKYTIQATLNRHHLKNYKAGDGVRWIKELEKLDFFNLSLIPAETDNSDLKISTPEELIALDSFTRELMNYFFDKIKRGDITKLASVMLLPLIRIAKRQYISDCSSGRSFMLDTDGSAYPCHMFCNESEYRIGGMDEEFNEKKAEEHNSHDRCKSSVCSSCIAEKSCFVWCRGLQHFKNNDLYEVCVPRCVFQRAITEKSILFLAGLRRDKEASVEFWKNYNDYQDSLRETFSRIAVSH